MVKKITNLPHELAKIALQEVHNSPQEIWAVCHAYLRQLKGK